jgi:hypothetical protein
MLNIFALALLLVSVESSAMLRRSISPPNVVPTVARLQAQEQNKSPTTSPVFRHRRNSATSVMHETFPLRHAPNITVETFFTRGEHRSYDTVVVDRNEMDFNQRQLYRITTFSGLESQLAHQAAEDWCTRTFGALPASQFMLRHNTDGMVPRANSMPESENSPPTEPPLINEARDEDDFT